GVGVVRDAVARLRGGVGVETERGRGTTFEIVVPLSLASVETLVVRADGQSVGIPFEAVSRVLRLSDAQLSNSPGGARLIHDGQAMPFASLARILGRGTGDGRQSTAVVLRSGDRHAAIGVDAVQGAANVVLRSLPDHAFATAIIAGAVLDAEGNPQAVFDAEALVTEIERQGGIVREDAEKVRPILIVDDSLTTRMLEQSILESAGYDVELAICAEDALEMARRQRYAMFLVDVEMPGMNGFSFIEQIRGDPVLHETPAILVTSLSDAADRRRGDEVGANGYVVKSEFNQAELLRMIGELVR
ncbi:MAG TPA: response regulator, partial [Bauldia sp.]|nr:response regulator [Bauldia sp.]